MRKCPTCGYLLLGDGDTCKHCGAALPLAAVVAAPPAAAAIAPSATEPAVPPSPPRIAPVPPATEPPPRIWSPPPMTAPPPSPLGTAPPPAPAVWQPSPSPVITRPVPGPSPARRVFAAFLAVAMVAGGRYAFSAIAGGQSLPAGTSAFAHGNGVSYSDPDGAYTAQFPTRATFETKDIDVDGGTLTANLASVSVDNSYEMGIASMPIAVPADKVDDSLKAGTDGFVTDANGTVLSQKRGTLGVAQTLDTRLKVDDGYTAHILVVISSGEMYVLFVHAKHGTDPLFSALDKSFVPRA